MEFEFTSHAILRMSVPVHVLYSIAESDEEKVAYIITVYRPDPCVICKEGVYQRGLATVVFTRGEAAVIIKAVPAQVCSQCGEYTLDAETTRSVLTMADEAFSKGTEVEIRHFAA